MCEIFNCHVISALVFAFGVPIGNLSVHAASHGVLIWPTGSHVVCISTCTRLISRDKPYAAVKYVDDMIARDWEQVLSVDIEQMLTLHVRHSDKAFLKIVELNVIKPLAES